MDTDKSVVQWVNGVCSALSIIGELFVIGSYYYHKQIQSFSMKLVLWLVYANLLFSISNLMSYWYTDPLICGIEGYLRTTSIISGLVWMVIILRVSYNQTFEYDANIDKKFPRYLLANIIISIAPGTITLLGDIWKRGPEFAVSEEGYFCDIMNYYFQLVLVDAPIWIAMFLTIWYCWKIITVIKTTIKKVSIKSYINIIIYPALMSALWLLPMINTLFLVFNNASTLVLMVVHIASSRLQGFFTAIIFGYTMHAKLAMGNSNNTVSDTSSSLLINDSVKIDSLEESVIERGLTIFGEDETYAQK